MREVTLNNNIRACIKLNKNTPRIAFTLNLSIVNPEKHAGEYVLLNRLLLKGTQKYSSVEIASILEENAIELSTEMKQDYLRFRFVTLNEDLELALSILIDIITNSTFEEFDKERQKLKGEIVAELDSAKVKLSDLFTKTIYKNHFYGDTYTKILEEIDNVTKENIILYYKEILANSLKKAVIVGDIDENYAIEILNKYIGVIPASIDIETNIKVPDKVTQERVELVKQDAQQAQILQGWHAPTIDDEDYTKMMLLNVILGSSGLSSRLFLELREKKGLAYTVRSSYEVHKQSAVFSIYIGTEPGNINTSLKGFEEEIEKIKNELVSPEELKNAKNNIIGKQQFITETNSQQANLMCYYAVSGKPFNFGETIIEKIKSVTSEDLKICANKYFTDDYVLSIIKP